MRTNSQVTQRSVSEDILYMGLDVHKNHINVTVMSDQAVISQSHVAIGDVESYVAGLQRKHPNSVLRAAYEAGFSGFATQRRLEALGVQTIVVNAADVPTTDKQRTSKSDRADSWKICHALRCDQLHAIWVPSVEHAGDRGLVRYRLPLKKARSQSMSRIRMFLHQQGIAIPDEFDRSYWSKAFRAWLNDQTMTSESSQMTYMLMLEEFEHADAVVSKHMKLIKTLSESDRYRKNVELLCSIPGIGVLTAMVILTELGPIDRFSSADRLASYVGLVPMRHQSGSSDRSMPIQRRAKTELRRMLVQSAWIAIGRANHFMDVYDRQRKIKRSQVAIIVVARKILNTIYAILKTSQPFTGSITSSAKLS